MKNEEKLQLEHDLTVKKIEETESSETTRKLEGMNHRPVIVSSPETYKRKSKVAVVGSASRTVEEAPYKDNEFEIWGLAWRNDKEFDRFHRIFDMHPLGANRQKVPKDYIELLNKRNDKIPLMVCLPDSQIKNATTYPIDHVVNFLGGVDEYFCGNYFMSSISYMFALAMFEGYEEIHIYGVDFVDDDEYIHQRPNQEYLIGLARGLGHRVRIPYKSAMCAGTHLYGYESPPGDSNDGLTLEILERELQETKKRNQEAMHFAMTSDGAIQTLEKQIAHKKRIRKGIKLDY